VQSAVVSAMSEADLRRGMEIAAIAGQLWTVSDVVGALRAPVIADFLEAKSEELQAIAVKTLLRFGATRALSEAMAKTSAEVEGLGKDEVTEGAIRLTMSDIAEEQSQDLAQAGVELTAEGLARMAAAKGMRQATEEMVAEGVTSVAEGAEQIGAAETVQAVADTQEPGKKEA